MSLIIVTSRRAHRLEARQGIPIVRGIDTELTKPFLIPDIDLNNLLVRTMAPIWALGWQEAEEPLHVAEQVAMLGASLDALGVVASEVFKGPKFCADEHVAHAVKDDKGAEEADDAGHDEAKHEHDFDLG